MNLFYIALAELYGRYSNWEDDMIDLIDEAGQAKPEKGHTEHVKEQAVQAERGEEQAVQAEREEEQAVSNSFSSRLPGFISFVEKGSASYATYFPKTFVRDGKVYHDAEYLGKVIDIDRCVFRSRARGTFTFSLEHGFGDVSTLGDPSIFDLPPVQVFNFGDIWMVDQILQQTGLDKILEDLIPESSDTLKSLISYKLLTSDASNYVSQWYAKSYARIIYPFANVESQRIRDFHAKLGTEENYRMFFESYLGSVIHNKNINNQISLVALIDSTRLENDINTFLTALSNNGDVTTNEMRITYVVDKNTKLPLFFRITVGNIIDNSLLINTINMLATYGVNVDVVIMDAGYASIHNILELISSNISFLTRMPDNRKEYKKLIEDHGANLLCPENMFKYGDRTLCGKRVPINFEGHPLFAYVMLDLCQANLDIEYAMNKYQYSEDRELKIQKALINAGKFILLSSNEYSIPEILPLYYTRQTIEQVFDIKTNYAGGLPLRGHSEATIRGIILISFIATIVNSSISHKLSGSKFSAHAAIITMRHLRLKVYDYVKILEELTKDQKEIFKLLNLANPFVVESGNKLHESDSFLAYLNHERRGRGRPMGSKNKSNVIQPNRLHSDNITDSLERPPRTECPKGHQNKLEIYPHQGMASNDGTPRRKGRPKGSKNKPKTDPSNELTSNISAPRKRGRPKGSKNKPKANS
jgi:hypothetical protein